MLNYRAIHKTMFLVRIFDNLKGNHSVKSKDSEYEYEF